MSKPEPPQNLWERMDELHHAEGYGKNDDVGGFTVLEYVEKYGMSIPGASARLAKMVREGKLTAAYTVRNGKRVRIYRFPDE